MDTFKDNLKLKRRVENVTNKFMKGSEPAVGTIRADIGYYEGNPHEDELTHSKWLLKTFGGNIDLISEKNNQKNPDYIWDGVEWELKSPIGNGKRTISNQINAAEKQIRNNPGGLILDCSNLNHRKSELQNIITNELRKKSFHGYVIIKCKNDLIAVLKIKEE